MRHRFGLRALLILTGVLFALTGLIAALFLMAPGLFGLSVYQVSTSSMAPGIPVGSAAYVVNDRAGSVGDVVVYQDLNGNEILHRIVGESLDGYLILKGDANRIPDPVPVSGDQIAGRMLVSIYGPDLFNGLLSILSALALCAGLSFILIGWSVGKPVARRPSSGGLD